MGKQEKGFTLIELLVVIAIIAILSTVDMAGLQSARAKGRDARRVSDIQAVQKALELFNDSCSGYPNLDPGIIGVNLTTATANSVSVPVCATAFGNFLAVIPTNVSPGGDDFMYCGTDNALPATADDDLDLEVGECEAAGSPLSDSYLIGFQLENITGALNVFEVTASPNGMISGGVID